MDHFNVTVEKDGALTTTRRGLRVSKQKHKGTSFVHSSAPRDGRSPSPPPRKKSSSSKTKSADVQFKFVTREDEESRSSSSRRSKTQRRSSAEEEDDEDDNDQEYRERDKRRHPHRRPKVSSRQTDPSTILPPISYSSSGMGQGTLSFTSGPELAGTTAYPPQQASTYQDFGSYYPATTAGMAYPVATAWPDMSGVVATSTQDPYYSGYMDLASQGTYTDDNPPQFPEMYYYDASSAHQRYGGHGGGGAGYP